jgi:multicomponent Na+:H+ antiporter subunit G
MELETLSRIFMITGCVFIFIASFGSLKFPDTLTRMAAIAKSSTLGVGLICVGGFFEFGWSEASAQLAFGTAFLFLAIPLSSHLLGRTRVNSRRALYENTQRNDFHGEE